MGAREAGELVKRYIDQLGLTQTTVAHELSQDLGRTIRQGQVSDHIKGLRWRGEWDLPGAYVRILGIPQEEMIAAFWGKGSKPGPRPMTLADVVKNDPTLSPAAKRHLLNQYELLQLASRQERRGRPMLSDPPPRVVRAASRVL